MSSQHAVCEISRIVRRGERTTDAQAHTGRAYTTPLRGVRAVHCREYGTPRTFAVGPRGLVSFLLLVEPA
jgi:hypothetical protein